MSTPASRNGSMRAADTDRIHVAQMLTDAAAKGRLPMTEYEDRLAKAYAAQTYDELERLSADLPGASTGAQRRPVPTRTVHAAPGDPERLRTPRPLERAEAVDLGRPVRWRRDRSALRRLHLAGRGDPLVLDLRRPDHRAAAGGERRRPRCRRDGRLRPHRDGLGSPGAPHITIRGFSLWGSVGIRRKKRKAPLTPATDLIETHR